MATIPSEDEIKEAQFETLQDINLKKASQEEQGKDFELPKGGGPGVMPEDVWQEHKES